MNDRQHGIRYARSRAVCAGKSQVGRNATSARSVGSDIFVVGDARIAAVIADQSVGEGDDGRIGVAGAARNAALDELPGCVLLDRWTPVLAGTKRRKCLNAAPRHGRAHHVPSRAGAASGSAPTGWPRSRAKHPETT